MTALEEVRQLNLNSDTYGKELAGADFDDQTFSCCGRCFGRLAIGFMHCWDSTQACLLIAINYLYDVLTLCISVADVATDIFVIYEFYVDKRDTFFIIAIIVMIIAQLAYCVAFIIKFTNSEHTWKNIMCIFICILPFSPIISFIFFITSLERNCLSSLFKKLGLNDGKLRFNSDSPPILVWIEKKMQKHMGFILEATIEALPQSIIQTIAIVYFQETRILNIISIIISLTSVATKSMVFSVAIDFKVFIFNWLSLVTDIFGVFAIIAWYVLLKCLSN